MRRFAVFVLVSLILVSLVGCAGNNNLPQKPQTNLQPGQKEEITPQLKADPVEENINGVDVEKDFNLTEEAEKEGYTEQDLLIPQEEVEKYREEIKRGEVIPLDKKGGNSDNQGQVNNSANGENVSQQAQLPQVEVVKEFATALPQGVIKELRYTNYPISYDYVLITKPDVNIRKEPNTRAEVISTGELYEKINLLQQVKGESVNGSDVWYRIFWKNDDQVQHGFVFGGGAEPRSFQFDKMLKAINDLKAEVDNNQTAFVFNYKNRNGMPPQYQGKDVDPNGNVRSQSAPGYVSPDPNSDFRYFPDGMLVTVLGEDENFYRVKSLSFPGEYWIPKAYISFWNSIQNLTQVIVVDRKNQNQATFENVNGSWKMISYTFCTTGLPGEYSLETPLGAYMAIEKKDRFFYTAEGSDQIAGYAPYAIRFSAGGYIHGVPVAYEKKDGEEVDPGLIEYLYTIGTTPRSHKCVRNFTSHALFLYNWAQIGNCAVVVIE